MASVQKSEQVLRDAQREFDLAASRLDEARREHQLALAEASREVRANAEKS
jgi:hypothetical protein